MTPKSYKFAAALMVVIWTTFIVHSVWYRNMSPAPATITSTHTTDPLFTDLFDDDNVTDSHQQSAHNSDHSHAAEAQLSQPRPVIDSSGEQQAKPHWPGYSVKALAYIFPAFYPFEENNKIWGEGWTEWVNVKGVEKNPLGLETIRPDESIGYYNGLDLTTRKRQAKYLKDMGFYGAVYHHYWFAGVPVMDHVIQAIFDDGEPDIPFMLSWANEPWEARWGGLNHDTVFIEQHYGHIADWRKHFDWCLPFFKHPLYIRSEGRVQFAIYKAGQMGHVGPHMFAAWRQWAHEEGFELDIIETRTSGASRWNQGEPDAINEFQPHVNGHDQTNHPWGHRTCRVYHRGMDVCWDATPRYRGDTRRSSPQAFCHPKTWEWSLVRMLGRIKNDPNPIGAENFMFVNALNEWGEGNTLEPSVQFGDAYSHAVKNAIATSAKIHKWPNQLVHEGYKQSLQEDRQSQPDVCVLIRAHPSQEENELHPLSDLMASLQAQENANWIAVAYQKDRDEFKTLEERIEQRLDLRLRYAVVPDAYHTRHGSKDAGYRATDWLLRNLTSIDPQCAGARYLLVTEGSHTYSPTAFNAVDASAMADVLSLSVESKETLFNHAERKKRDSWEDRCDWLEDVGRYTEFMFVLANRIPGKHPPRCDCRLVTCSSRRN